MATLTVVATPSDDLRRYTLAIDRKKVRMMANNQGSRRVDGECGDGSVHTLGYSLFGPAGSTLGIKVECGGVVVKQLDGIEVFPEGEPFAAGEVEFEL